MYKKILFILLFCLLCVGCNDNKVSDSVKFKREYEKLNNKNITLDIDEENIVVYSDVSEVNDIIKNGSGVIYVGSPDNDVSRKVIEVLLKVSDSTDLEKIYYINNLDGIKGIDDVKGFGIPTVLFVLDGKIVKYQVGIDSLDVNLSKEEEMKLYNIYLEGIHEVLQDTCDERC